MGGIISPFTFQKKSYVTPMGPVSGNESQSAVGSQLSHFSQMAASEDREIGESGENADERKFLDRVLGGP